VNPTNHKKKPMSTPFRLGCIGTDSSHLIEFSKRIKALNDAGRSRCLVTGFWTDGKHDMPADQVAKWEADTAALGAKRVGSMDELLAGVDGVLVLAVNGHRHAELAAPSLNRGLPTYVDKPMTCDLGQAKALLAAARKSGARCYSASSLRFAREVTEQFDRAAIGDIAAIEAFGPGELNPAMEGLFFYGVHTIEMVDAMMGKAGVAKVRATTDDRRELVDLQYHDGRVARLRMERVGGYDFGASVHGTKGVYQFKVDFNGVYDRLVAGMCQFFTGGPAPADMRDIVENIAVMEAGNRSIRNNGTWEAVETIV
jgi:predicted dehydrogenase